MSATSHDAGAASPQLSVSLAVPAGKADAAAGVFVDFTLSNRSSAPVSVLTWNTPFEGFKGDIFQVSLNGQRIGYIGRLVKRAAPGPADYLTLAAGEAKTVHVNLAEAYAITAPGAYRVQFDSIVLDVAAAAPTAAEAAARFRSSTPVPLTSPEVTIDVSKGRTISSPQPVEPTTPGRAAVTTFNGCTAQRQTLLKAALINARSIANGARNSLSSTPISSRPTAKRSKLWFGAYNSTRYALVLSHYTKIAAAMLNQSYQFDCTCTESGVYAYVFPNAPYTVYLCGAYWSAPATGTDSKAGTLVHESSHFTVLGGTNDWVYGQSGAKQLAISNPGKAVTNADSHEYFAENTPFVSQP